MERIQRENEDGWPEDRLPAGERLNGLIQQMIFKAVPLTDNEYGLLRAGWEMVAPSWAGQSRPYKVQLSKVELEARKIYAEREDWHEPAVFATYRLQWPADFSGDIQAAQMVVYKMRADGWMYELCDLDDGKIKKGRFRMYVLGEDDLPKEIVGQAFGGTDALAIARASVCAAIELRSALDRGCKME